MDFKGLEGEVFFHALQPYFLCKEQIDKQL